LVEVNQEIPDRDEAELRRAVQGGEPSAASRVFDERPTSRGALDLAPGSRSYGCAATARNKMKNEENFLDTAADVIHGNWLFGPGTFFRRQFCQLQGEMGVIL
jgi:hypothetical protein